MTSNIEKQFYEVFGIEPKTYLLCTSGWDCIDAQPCEQCGYSKLIEDEYPPITDRILLQLICILSEWKTYSDSEYTIKSDDISSLKEDILNDCLEMYSWYLEMYNWYEFKKHDKDVKQRVQALFEENN